jgi:DNA-binding response OmpR family regulator
MKILLVDDEVEFLEALCERLNLRDYDTDCVTSGQEALDMVQVNSYDVVILDVKMPGLSGIELMEALRSYDPSLQFIFVTGHGSAGDYEACSKEGLCETIIKPLKLDELLAQIDRVAEKGGQD